MPTRHPARIRTLNQATVSPGYLKVCYGKKQVKDAPSIDTDGELPAAGPTLVAPLSGGSDVCLLSTAGDSGDRVGYRHRRIPRRPTPERPVDAAAIREALGLVIPFDHP
jgi:hypothetical protein